MVQKSKDMKYLGGAMSSQVMTPPCPEKSTKLKVFVGWSVVAWANSDYRLFVGKP